MYPSQSQGFYQPSNPNKNSDSRRGFHDILRENPRQLLLPLAIGSIVILLIIVLAFFRHDESVNQEPETAPIPAFEHRYLVESSIGQRLSDSVFSDIGNIIIDDKELASAPNTSSSETDNIYEVNLSEDSYRILNKEQSIPTYKIDLEVSDGRAYTLQIRTDNKSYMITTLDRTDNESIPDHVFIRTDEEGKAKETIDKLATQWAESLELNNPQFSNASFSKLFE